MDKVIEIEHLKKQYRLGSIGTGQLITDLESWWARLRGKEDPNVRIGEDGSVGGSFYALDDINLDVYRGDTLGVIGSNGAGKSTMLKLLSRVTAPTEGVIRVRGRISSMLEVGTGFDRELTGRDNVYLNGAILGMSRAEITRKLDDIIEFSECGQFIDTPVKRYSSGMYVKLAFSVAAHLDSEILIMDEVLAVGDMAFQKKCLDKMSSIASGENRTILYVSHNMNTIRRLCKRCIVLDHGHLIYDGDTEEAIQVYLKCSQNELSDVTDLKERTRDGSMKDTVRMQQVKLLNADHAVIEQGSNLGMLLEWAADGDSPKVRIRCTISDGGNVIGSAISPVMTDAVAGKTYSSELVLETGTLISGKYYVNLTLCHNDESGVSRVYDDVPMAFAIQVKHGFFDNPQEWDRRQLGIQRFADIQVKDCGEIANIKGECI
jgi:lipopolysaccharide transport system ATP-binding protein